MDNYKFVPAAAGFYALWQIEIEPGFGRAIITGWQIDTTAITHVSNTTALIEGDNLHNIEAILCPDGSVQEVDSGTFWPDIARWLESPPPPPAVRRTAA